MAQEVTTGGKTEMDQASGNEATRTGPVYRPLADVYETEDRLVVATDMPGVAPDGVDVTLERRVLTIRGHVRPTAPQGYRRVAAEYGVGDYERVFTLSEDIDQKRIKAVLKDGVLTLELPKAPAAKPKKISVKAA